MANKRKKLIQPVIFFLLLFLIVIGIRKPFTNTDYRIYQMMEGLYQEEEGALDAVYVGASNTYSFWQAPMGWANCGIAVYPYSVPGLPAAAIKNMIIEARKTQPDALYIITLNCFKKETVNEVTIHNMTNFMRLSRNKIQIIHQMSDMAGLSLLERMEFYFPIVRFHSNWSNLESDAFVREPEGMKAGVYYRSFLESTASVNAGRADTGELLDLTEEQQTVLDDLLAYLKEENVEALFVCVPQDMNRTPVGHLNKLCQLVQEAGYPALNMCGSAEEIGLSETEDYYDEKHVNIHGSAKYVAYLSQYLKENYGFEDKRGKAGYESWDEADEKYLQVTAPYILDFEYEGAGRCALPVPANQRTTVDERGATVYWDPVEGAEAYVLFRKEWQDYDAYGGWERIAELPAGTLSYLDAGLSWYRTYAYTVVPARQGENGLEYGLFNLEGVEAVTPLDPNPPPPSSSEEEELAALEPAFHFGGVVLAGAVKKEGGRP